MEVIEKLKGIPHKCGDLSEEDQRTYKDQRVRDSSQGGYTRDVTKTEKPVRDKAYDTQMLLGEKDRKKRDKDSKCYFCDELNELVSRLLDVHHNFVSSDKKAQPDFDKEQIVGKSLQEKSHDIKPELNDDCEMCSHMCKVSSTLLDLHHSTVSLSKEAQSEGALHTTEMSLGKEGQCKVPAFDLDCDICCELEETFHRLLHLPHKVVSLKNEAQSGGSERELKGNCEICHQLNDIFDTLLDVPHVFCEGKKKKMKTADDRGRTAGFSVSKEDSCTRRLLKVGCDKCNRL